MKAPHTKFYSEDNAHFLARKHQCAMARIWKYVLFCLSSCTIAIIVGLLTQSSSLMMVFACCGILSMFKLIETLQDKISIHSSIVCIASDRGRLPYHEVLVQLDMLGINVKLNENAYSSYRRRWNFDDAFGNGEI